MKNLTLLAMCLMFLGGCATIDAASATSEPGWFIAKDWGTDDILYCYPPHYKQSKYAGKCFTIN